MAEDNTYTQDGTINIYGKPANKKKTGNWKACWFILGNECVERLAYYGMTTNLVNYLQDRFNQGNAAAANNVTTWSGTCYITPLIGAFIADAYLGRYRTIASFSVIYVTGMILLTLFASAPGLKPSCDANGCHPTSVQTAANFIALYMIAVGTGGIKPCVSSFGADQFDETDEKERKKKGLFFNWFYLSINVGALLASIIVWIQINVGWEWGFGIPAVAMIIAIIFFFGGSQLYRLQIPGGSPLARIFQVIVAASRKSNLQLPADTSLLHESVDVESYNVGSRKLYHTNNLKYLDKAAIVTPSDLKDFPNPWRLCTVTQVEELKSIIHLLPVWASLIVVATVYHQIGTMFVLQGNTMDQHIGSHFKIPPASLSLFDTIPQYLLIGCAEVFASIGQMEFFYGQAPDAMRSLGAALSLTTYALGGYISTLFVTVVNKVTTTHDRLGWIPDNLNRGHLDYFFWLLSLLCFLDFLVFLWIAKRYRYKKVAGI